MNTSNSNLRDGNILIMLTHLVEQMKQVREDLKRIEKKVDELEWEDEDD